MKDYLGPGPYRVQSWGRHAGRPRIARKIPMPVVDFYKMYAELWADAALYGLLRGGTRGAAAAVDVAEVTVIHLVKCAVTDCWRQPVVWTGYESGGFSVMSWRCQQHAESWWPK